MNKDKIGEKNIKYKTDSEKLRKSEIRKLRYMVFSATKKSEIIIATKALSREELKSEEVKIFSHESACGGRINQREEEKRRQKK